MCCKYFQSECFYNSFLATSLHRKDDKNSIIHILACTLFLYIEDLVWRGKTRIDHFWFRITLQISDRVLWILLAMLTEQKMQNRDAMAQCSSWMVYRMQKWELSTPPWFPGVGLHVVILQLPGGTWKEWGVAQLIWKNRNYDLNKNISTYIVFSKKPSQLGLYIGQMLTFSKCSVTITIIY